MTFTQAGIFRLNKELNEFGSRVIPAELVKRQKQVAILLLTGFTLKTPVKTGRARGGWIVSVNRASTSERKKLDRSGSSTISEGIASMRSIVPFSTIFIDNNVKYIPPLEDGHSGQAPNGMIAVTIEEVLAHRFTDSDPSGT